MNNVNVTLPSGTKVEMTLAQFCEFEAQQIQTNELPSYRVNVEDIDKVANKSLIKKIVRKPRKKTHPRFPFTLNEKIEIALTVLEQHLILKRKPSFSISRADECPIVMKVMKMRPEKSKGAAVTQLGIFNRIFLGEKHVSDNIRPDGKKIGIQGNKTEYATILAYLSDKGLTELPAYHKIVQNFGKPSGGLFK